MTTILLCIITSTIITAIIDFAKPMWKGKVWKWNVTISNWLAFVLWIIWAFAILPYVPYEINWYAIVLAWLALGTWATVIYKILDLIKSRSDKLSANKQ